MTDREETYIGWAVFTDTIIDEVVVERETASQFIGCKIERVILRSLEPKVIKDGLD